jgi:hypothetical protein
LTRQQANGSTHIILAPEWRRGRDRLAQAFDSWRLDCGCPGGLPERPPARSRPGARGQPTLLVPGRSHHLDVR